jgi:hypothetical protein
MHDIIQRKSAHPEKHGSIAHEVVRPNGQSICIYSGVFVGDERPAPPLVGGSPRNVVAGFIAGSRRNKHQ